MTTVFYRSLQRLVVRTVKGWCCHKVAPQCLAYASDCDVLSLIPYDATTLSFQAEPEDDLRRIGQRRRCRGDPYIAAGLLVVLTGFPLEISCRAGNTAQITTIVPIITSVGQQPSLPGTPVVVAADAGTSRHGRSCTGNAPPPKRT